MRTFGWPELWFIVEAAKWTIALSAIAFVGGAIVGLIVILLKGILTERITAFMARRQGVEL